MTWSKHLMCLLWPFWTLDCSEHRFLTSRGAVKNMKGTLYWSKWSLKGNYATTWIWTDVVNEPNWIQFIFCTFFVIFVYGCFKRTLHIHKNGDKALLRRGTFFCPSLLHWLRGRKRTERSGADSRVSTEKEKKKKTAGESPEALHGNQPR